MTRRGFKSISTHKLKKQRYEKNLLSIVSWQKENRNATLAFHDFGQDKPDTLYWKELRFELFLLQLYKKNWPLWLLITPMHTLQFDSVQNEQKNNEVNEATELLKDEDEVVKLDLKIQEKRLKVGAYLRN